MEVKYVFLDGQIIPQEVVNITPEDMIASFKGTVTNMAAISMEADILNSLSVPIHIANSFKNLLAIGLESGFQFKELQ